MGAYSDYLVKVRQQAKTLHRLLFAAKIILPLLLIIIAALSFYSSRRGTITEEVSCPDIMYGEPLEYSAKALHSKVKYYFTKEGADEKTDTVPTETGTYTIEAVGGNGRGEHKHSSTVFRILPGTATVTVKDTVCQYGDEPQIELGYTGLVPGSSIGSFTPVFTYSEDGTSAGISVASSSLVILSPWGKDVSSCYSVEIISGRLTMEKRSITVAAVSRSFEYDGLSHGPDSVTVTEGSLREGDRIASYEFSDYNVSPGQYICIPEKITIRDADGNDVSSLYNITEAPGYITIERRTLTVTSESLSSPYTGELISCKKYAVSSGSLPEGDVLSVVFENEGYRAAGVYTNDFTCSVSNSRGEDISSCYNIITVPGTVTVEGTEITVTTGSAEKGFDMTALSCDTYTLEGSLRPGHRLWVTGFTTIYNAGTADNSAIISITDSEGRDVSEGYILNTVWGKLTISKRKLTLTSESVSYEYGSTQYSCTNFALTSGTLPGDGSLVIKITPTFSATVPGIHENSFDYAVYSAVPSPNSAKGTVFISDDGTLHDGGYAIRTNYTDCFDVNYEPGTVTIYSETLILKSASTVKYYDGLPLTAEDCFAVDSYLWPELSVEAVYTGSQTEVGSSANYFTARVTDSCGIDVTDKYYKNVYLEYGTLRVLPAEAGSSGTDMSGQLSLGSEGEISTSSFTPSGKPLFKVKSDYTGYIYLRYKSYGDFNGTDGWEEADEYSYLSRYSYFPLYPYYLYSQFGTGDSCLPYNPLGYSLKALKTKSINILSLDGQAFTNRLLPCYSVTAPYASGLNVLEMNGKNEYDFRIVTDFDRYSSALISDDDSLAYAYSTFAKRYYISLDQKIPNALSNFNKEMNKSISDADKKNNKDYAYQIASYVSKSAEYSFYYEDIPEGENVISYFLNNSKRGVCSHFAAATTILCRLNGIPARYTTGYIAEAKEGETVTVTAKNAHAWTEVYDESTQMWFVLDSTPGFMDLGNSGDTDTEENPAKIQLEIQMSSDSKYFDGYPLSCNSFYILEGKLLEGHSLTCVSNSSRLYVGTCPNELASFTVTDAEGNDVSALYEIYAHSGTLTVNTVSSFPINEFAARVGETVRVDSKKLGLGITVDCIEKAEKSVTGKTYGARTIYYFSMDTDINGDGISEFAKTMSFTLYTYSRETLNLTGLTSEEALSCGILTPGDGTVRTEVISGSALYLLDVCMGSASKTYDGQELVCDSSAILCGALHEGDRLIVTGSGLQIYAGSCRNSCAKLAVISSSGMDVTDNYIINVYDGTLTVTCPTFTGESASVKMGLLSSCKLETLRRCTDADSTEYSLDGDAYFMISVDKLRTVAPGEAKLTAVSSFDVNRDGVADYMLLEETHLTCTVPGWLWCCGAGFALLCAVYFISKLRRKKPEDDGNPEDDGE